jgi:hypothetical protein
MVPGWYQGGTRVVPVLGGWVSRCSHYCECLSCALPWTGCWTLGGRPRLPLCQGLVPDRSCCRTRLLIWQGSHKMV